MQPVILVAEDEELIRFIVAEYLSDAGFGVVEASNAADALSVISSMAAVDLVFTDINMPGDMDGNALADWLLVHRPDIPVLLTSGVSRPRPRNGGWKRRFLLKPYALVDVEKSIRELLH